VPREQKTSTAVAASGNDLGFEAKLWLTADKLRTNKDGLDSVTWHQ
jgi:hypothetical protein